MQQIVIDIKDPLYALSKYYLHELGPKLTETVVMPQTEFVDRANEWAKKHGYGGYPITLKMAKRFLIECRGDGIVINSDAFHAPCFRFHVNSPSVMSQSDPKLDAFCKFIEERVDFNPPRQGKERVRGVVRRDELIDAIKRKHQKDGTFKGVSSREIKALADAAMSYSGRKLALDVLCRGTRYLNVYKNCEIRGENDE